MFILTFLEKIKEATLKYATKNKAETILRMTKKTLQDKELLHELFLKTGQTTKIRNSFANNI